MPRMPMMPLMEIINSPEEPIQVPVVVMTQPSAYSLSTFKFDTPRIIMVIIMVLLVYWIYIQQQQQKPFLPQL